MNALAVTYFVPFHGNRLSPVDFCRNRHLCPAVSQACWKGDDLPSVRRIFERDGTIDDIC